MPARSAQMRPAASGLNDDDDRMQVDSVDDGDVRPLPSTLPQTRPLLSPTGSTIVRRSLVEDTAADRRFPDAPWSPWDPRFRPTRRSPRSVSAISSRPTQGIPSALPQHEQAAAQELLIEQLAGLSLHSPSQSLQRDVGTPTPARASPSPQNTTNDINGTNERSSIQANAGDPPPWLSTLLNFVFSTLTLSTQGTGNVRPLFETPGNPNSDGHATQDQPRTGGSRGSGTNVLLADVGEVASPTDQRDTDAPRPVRQGAPIRGRVSVPLSSPFFGGDSGQARRLIEGLMAIPAGLVTRYIRAEKATHGGVGACAICYEELECDLGRDQSAPRWASDYPQEDAPAVPAPRPVSTAPAPVPGEPLRHHLVVLPCGHAFHSTCLQPWFTQQTTCPNCRHHVDLEDLTSSAYVGGQRGRVHAPSVIPPPALHADSLAHFRDTAPSQPYVASAEPTQRTVPNLVAPSMGTSQRFTFTPGAFPALGGNAPRSPPGHGTAGSTPTLTLPSGLWLPAPSQAGVEMIYDVLEVELMTIPVGSVWNTLGATNDVQQQTPQQAPEQQHPHDVPQHEILVHIVVPVDDALHLQQQQNPDANTAGNASGQPHGRTVRQHVEKRERELGLRCDLACCALAPTDDDPEPTLHGEMPKLMRLQSANHTGQQCTHEFHPQCIVTATSIPAQRPSRAVAGPIPVSCPICAAEGAVEPADWAAGELALPTQVE
ncbi:hypothetical protein AURDEDRAFT_128882 [Auricularia subglabra TFB-10046 SS5]|nr:hypothetical protein AURDEDRAFT_128882 [Auricularia subglabra TFB-10046 SS5]